MFSIDTIWSTTRLCTGLKQESPPIADLFYDTQFCHGDFYKLWGYDFLHHWLIGTLKRLCIDQLKVWNHKSFARQVSTVRRPAAATCPVAVTDPNLQNSSDDSLTCSR